MLAVAAIRYVSLVWKELIILGAAVLLILVASASNEVEKHYPTRSEAQHKGTWVPEWVPSTARDIHDVHNIDTIEQTLTFVVPQSDIQPMVAGLPRLYLHDVEAARRLATELGWREKQSPAQLEAYNDCGRPADGGILFVDRKSGRVLYSNSMAAGAAHVRCSQ